MPPTVHLVRHGQGCHQLGDLQQSQQIHDPLLTHYGIQCCDRFNEFFPEYVDVDLICASPLRRAILTAQHCFRDRLPGTPSGRILLLPTAQETTAEPCDVGTEVETLEEQFGPLIDTKLMYRDWMVKDGTNAVDVPALKLRARGVRRWLRGLEVENVVVVGHGGFWDYVTEVVGDEGLGKATACVCLTDVN